MRNLLILLIITAQGVLLAGCSTTANYLSAFRNRENDYIHQAVFVRAPLKAAKGQNKVAVDPLYKQPKTAVLYPAKKEAPSLLPPTLAKK